VLSPSWPFTACWLVCTAPHPTPPSFPTNTVFRLWDVIFYEGSETLPLVAAAHFLSLAQPLLQCQSMMEVLTTVKRALPFTHNVNDLIEAVEALRLRFPPSRMRELRRHHWTAACDAFRAMTVRKLHVRVCIVHSCARVCVCVCCVLCADRELILSSWIRSRFRAPLSLVRLASPSSSMCSSDSPPCSQHVRAVSLGAAACRRGLLHPDVVTSPDIVARLPHYVSLVVVARAPCVVGV